MKRRAAIEPAIGHMKKRWATRTKLATGQDRRQAQRTAVRLWPQLAVDAAADASGKEAGTCFCTAMLAMGCLERSTGDPLGLQRPIRHWPDFGFDAERIFSDGMKAHGFSGKVVMLSKKNTAERSHGHGTQCNVCRTGLPSGQAFRRAPDQVGQILANRLRPTIGKPFAR